MFIMNEWITKSIKLANEQNYLDRLLEVYPVKWEAKREISEDIKMKIKNAFNKQNHVELLRILLQLEKFPIKDPYVAFLRKSSSFIEKNPITVERIATYLYSLGYEAVIEGIEEPKEFNRQIGILFKCWLKKLAEEFKKSDFISFVLGANGELMRIANELGCALDKGPDLFVKVGSTYVIGEAKFLTDYGGHQNAQFEDSLRFLANTQGNAIRIAILDGVIWIKNRSKMHKKLINLNKPIMSALLLKDFLEELRLQQL